MKYTVKVTKEAVIPIPLRMADLEPGTIFHVVNPNTKLEELGLIVTVLGLKNSLDRKQVVWLKEGDFAMPVQLSINKSKTVIPLALGETVTITPMEGSE